MSPSRRRKLFLASSKGRLLDLLRRAPQTVDELASGLAITGPAVRTHLMALARDGLVQEGDLRRTSARRPSRTYRLAPAAEAFFCQGFVPFLDALLGVLAGKLPRRNLDEVVRAVGRRLARPTATGALAARVAAAAGVLDQLGGVTEVKTRRNGGITYEIVGLSCPLGAIARAHPSVCVAIESLVAEMTRAQARQGCHREEDQPHCLIEVTPRA